MIDGSGYLLISTTKRENKVSVFDELGSIADANIEFEILVGFSNLNSKPSFWRHWSCSISGLWKLR